MVLSWPLPVEDSSTSSTTCNDSDADSGIERSVMVRGTTKAVNALLDPWILAGLDASPSPIVEVPQEAATQPCKRILVAIGSQRSEGSRNVGWQRCERCWMRFQKRLETHDGCGVGGVFGQAKGRQKGSYGASQKGDAKDAGERLRD